MLGSPEHFELFQGGFDNRSSFSGQKNLSALIYAGKREASRAAAIGGRASTSSWSKTAKAFDLSVPE